MAKMPAKWKQRRVMLKAAIWRLAKIIHQPPSIILVTEDPYSLIREPDRRARQLCKKIIRLQRTRGILPAAVDKNNPPKPMIPKAQPFIDEAFAGLPAAGSVAGVGSVVPAPVAEKPPLTKEMAEKLLGRTTPAATVTEPAAVKTPAKTRVAKAAAVAVDEEEEEVVEKPVKRTRVTKVAAVAADDDAEEKPAKKKVVRKKPTA